MNSNTALIRLLATALLSEISSSPNIGKSDDDINDVNNITHDDLPLPEKIREFEIKLIQSALVKTGGNQRRAARLLGLKAPTLHRKIACYQIEVVKE